MQGTPAVIIAASDQELSNPNYYANLWQAVRRMPIPRRCWLDQIADAFRDYEGMILNADGTPFEIPLVDDVFGDDADMRWLGLFMEADRTGERPARISKKIDRLRVIDLYFRIRFPRIVRAFHQQ